MKPIRNVIKLIYRNYNCEWKLKLWKWIGCRKKNGVDAWNNKKTYVSLLVDWGDQYGLETQFWECKQCSIWISSVKVMCDSHEFSQRSQSVNDDHRWKIEGIYMHEQYLKCHPMAKKFKSQIGRKPVVAKTAAVTRVKTRMEIMSTQQCSLLH